jgi:transposase
MKSFALKNSKGDTSEYFLFEKECTYENTPLKVVVCYSKNLEATKKRTIDKQIIEEKEAILKLGKTYSKRSFACEEDATEEISKLLSKDLKKIKYHNVSLTLDVIDKKKRGRQPKDLSKVEYIREYYVKFDLKEDENKVKRQFEEACTFVLCSTDLNLAGEEILTEYKTQSSVEKKFQQLKSPHFVNSLYLDTPERIEALTYMILISMMILSIAEHVVRRELKVTGEKIIGPGGVKMSQPTLWAILLIFSVGIGVKVLSINGKKHRSLARPLKDNHKRILECLSIPESIFCWQG